MQSNQTLPSRESSSSNPFQNSSAEASALEELNLPIDPKRYLGGIWKRRGWLIMGLILGIMAGMAYGLLTTRTMYEATTQLIRREVPSSFRAGEVGTPFQPTAFSEETFSTLATSSKVLERVAEKFSPKLNLRALQVSTSTARERRTDILNLTVSVHTSPEESTQVANAWAREVVELTRELQAQEAKEIRQLLQDKVDSLNRELTGFNDQIESLRQQEILVTKINTSKIELKELQARYTNQNPIVQAKLDAIAAMEKELAASDLRSGKLIEGSPSSGVTSQEGMIEKISTKAETHGLPQETSAHFQKTAILAQLEERKQSVQMSYNLLFSRLLEAKLFEEHPPGYYQIFSPASIDRVSIQGRLKRTSLYGLAGGLLACCLVLGLVIGTEVADPLLRTSGEIKKIVSPVQVFPLLPYENTTQKTELISSVWVHSIDAAPKQVRVIWSPAPHEHEQLFWNLMISHASKLVDSLLVVDCAPSKNVSLDKAFKNLPSSFAEKIKLEVKDCSNLHITEAERFKNEIIQRSGSFQEVWVRLAGPVKEPLTTIQKAGAHPLVLVNLHQNTKIFWENEFGLLAETIGTPSGVVTLGEKPWYRF